LGFPCNIKAISAPLRKYKFSVVPGKAASVVTCRNGEALYVRA
jgi:hypothetical protein